MEQRTVTGYEEKKAALFEEIDRHEPSVRALSDWLFQNPETSGLEFESSKKIAAFLEANGYRVELPVGGEATAFAASSGAQCGEKNDEKSAGESNGRKRGRQLAIMVEYDALPDIGHACGHNVSAGISLLAALALRPLQDALDLDVRIIGTPAEERGGGKVALIEHGLFDDADMAMMVHVYNGNVLSPVCLALRGNYYTFTGAPAHAAASPWEGRNALNGAQLFLHAVDMLRQHVQPDVRMHGIIREGGTIPNTVPERAVCELFVRALDKGYAASVQKLVDDCAKGAAIATQTECSIAPSVRSYDDLKKNEPGLAALADVFSELGLALDSNSERPFASTDAGNVSYVCPTFHPCLQIAPAGTELHTQAFAQYAGGEAGRNALATGAKIIGLQVLKVFGDDRLLADIAADFNR